MSRYKTAIGVKFDIATSTMPSSTHPVLYDECLMLDWKTSACLIEDNIFWRLHTSVIVNRGSSGNAVAYNFSRDMYTSGSDNFMPIDIDMCHGAHTMFNLAEGNICRNLISDAIWGSSSHTTLFRNYMSADNFTSYPQDARYGGPTGTPLPAPTDLLTYPTRQTQAEVGIWLGDLAPYFNVVGNIVGDSYVGANGNTVYQALGAFEEPNGWPYKFLLELRPIARTVARMYLTRRLSREIGMQRTAPSSGQTVFKHSRRATILLLNQPISGI